MLSDVLKRNELFRKRKGTILKKAHQLAALSGADVMVFLRYGTQTIAYNDNHGEAWPTLEQANGGGYLLDASSFRSLSPSRAGGHRGQHLASSTEDSMTSNNQESSRSRFPPSLDRTNVLPDANSVLDNLQSRNSTDANSDSNLAQIPKLTDHDDPSLRRCDTLQPGTSSNYAGLRIRTDADPNAGVMQGQEAVSWDVLRSGDVHPSKMVSQHATVRTVSEANHNAGRLNLHDHVIPNTIPDPSISLAGTMERAVVSSRDMHSIYNPQCKSPSREDVDPDPRPVAVDDPQSTDSQPLRCYGHTSHDTESSKLSYEGGSKLIKGFSQLWPLDDNLLDDNTQRWTPTPEIDLTKTADSTESNGSLLLADYQDSLHHTCRPVSGDASQQKEPDSLKTTKPTLRELLRMATYTVDKSDEPLATDEQSTDKGQSTQTHRHCQPRVGRSLQANIGMSKPASRRRTTSDANGDGQDAQSQCYRQTRSQTKRIAEADAKRAAKRSRT